MAVKISHLPDEIIVDEQIVLRAKSKDSYPAFAEVVVENIDHLSEWLPWAIGAPNQSSVEHYEQAPFKKANNESADWDIYFNGKYAGAIGLMHRDPSREVLEIGYWLAKDFVGKGIVTKCLTKITEVTFLETTIDKIEVGADIKNERSKAVPKRCGYKFDREFTDNPNCPQVELGVFYSITRSEWEKLRSPK